MFCGTSASSELLPSNGIERLSKGIGGSAVEALDSEARQNEVVDSEFAGETLGWNRWSTFTFSREKLASS